jgi:trehalose-6-phosphatase
LWRPKAERKLEGVVALVSGRGIDDLDRLFVPLRLSGVHGAQIRFESSEPATPSRRRSSCRLRCGSL